MLAPIENVDKKTLYVADESPVDLCDFANQIQEELGVRKIRHMPLRIAKTAAKIGDVLEFAGWLA